MSLSGHVSKIVSIQLSKLSKCPNSDTSLCYYYISISNSAGTSIQQLSVESWARPTGEACSHIILNPLELPYLRHCPNLFFQFKRLHLPKKNQCRGSNHILTLESTVKDTTVGTHSLKLQPILCQYVLAHYIASNLTCKGTKYNRLVT